VRTARRLFRLSKTSSPPCGRQGERPLFLGACLLTTAAATSIGSAKKGAGAVTEECFQQTPLEFASGSQIIHYEDGSHVDVKITAIDVSEGTIPTGSTWRKNPVPACNCDSGFTCGQDNTTQNKPYEAQSNPGGQCPTGLQFDAPVEKLFGFFVSLDAPRDAPLSIVSIIDEVKVPEEAGEYLLSWRWDCEQTPQVWNSCADITISSSLGSVHV